MFDDGVAKVQANLVKFSQSEESLLFLITVWILRRS